MPSHQDTGCGLLRVSAHQAAAFRTCREMKFALLVMFDGSCPENSPGGAAVGCRPLTDVKSGLGQKDVCRPPEECGHCRRWPL